MRVSVFEDLIRALIKTMISGQDGKTFVMSNIQLMERIP